MAARPARRRSASSRAIIRWKAASRRWTSALSAPLAMLSGGWGAARSISSIEEMRRSRGSKRRRSSTQLPSEVATIAIPNTSAWLGSNECRRASTSSVAMSAVAAITIRLTARTWASSERECIWGLAPISDNAPLTDNPRARPPQVSFQRRDRGPCRRFSIGSWSTRGVAGNGGAPRVLKAWRRRRVRGCRPSAPHRRHIGPAGKNVPFGARETVETAESSRSGGISSVSADRARSSGTIFPV